MKLLILGGTVFLGRHLVAAALAAGHDVTLFNRGRSNPDLFAGVETLRGDRDSGDLATLRGRTWDAVVDTCGYTPRVVRESVELLAQATEHYTFISTISVYGDLAGTHGDLSRIGMDERAPVAQLHPGDSQDAAGLPTYGALKALCEQIVADVMPGRALAIRCGLIVGPYDRSDRFTYWVHRISAGGDVLAPGSPAAPVQIIDVRDLVEWILRLVEQRVDGVFNATGPDYPLTMGALLEASRRVCRNDARLIWVPDEVLLAAGVRPFVDLPIWIPHQARTAGFMTVNVEKARRQGLSFRPLARTVRETLAWSATLPADYEWTAGMSREHERELLATVSSR